jgi:hypothetical protein
MKHKKIIKFEKIKTDKPIPRVLLSEFTRTRVISNPKAYKRVQFDIEKEMEYPIDADEDS